MNAGIPQNSQEQEWQFAAPGLDGARRWIAQQPRDPKLRRFEPLATVELSDIYYDSPDWMILRARYALRLRRSRDPHDETREVTIKSLQPARGALASRTELSQRVTATDIEAVLGQGDGMGERIRAIAKLQDVLGRFQDATV